MPYTPFRSRRGIHHIFIIRYLERFWKFFWKSSFGLKLVFVGALLGVIGLASPWVYTENTGSYSAFSILCGGVGWFIMLFLASVFITLFSYDLQEKTKKYFGITFDPKKSYKRAGWLILLVTTIVNIMIIGSARTLGSGVQLSAHFSGMVWTIVSALSLIAGGRMVERSEKTQSYTHVFVQGVEPEEDEAYRKILGDENGDDNMKLPI